MFGVDVVCYPWDLEDVGIESALDRLGGEIGIDGVVVPASSGPLCHLRRLADAQPRIMRSEGGLLFQFDDAKYSATRCKPLVANVLKSRNPLSKIGDACRRSGLGFRVVVETRRIGRLAERNAQMTTVTAYGEASGACLCLTNPDVAEFFRSMIGDLWANYEPDRIELRDMGRSLAGYTVDHIDGVDALGPGGCALMSVCFCASCLQQAGRDGVDGEAARRSAWVTLGRAIETGQPLEGSLDDLTGEDELLGRYICSQTAAHVELIGSLAKQCECGLGLHVDGDEGIESGLLEALGSGPRTVIVEPGFEITQENAGRLSELRDRCRSAGSTGCEVQVGVGGRVADDRTTLVKILQHLVESGIDGAQLYHLGMMAESDFTSAKQAVRYAKRSSGS